MKLIYILSVLLLSFKGYSQSASPLCGLIEKEIDKFEKTASLWTPILKDCFLTKEIKKGKVIVYYLYLNSYSSTVNVGKKGLKIILSNEQILSFPSVDIDVDVDHDRYRYSAFFSLTDVQIGLLKKYKITDWKLYIHVNTLTDQDSEEFRTLVNCLVGLE